MSGNEERIERARRGSRRKRDLAAVEVLAAETTRRREQRLLADLRPSAEAQAVWAEVRVQMQASLSEFAFATWIAPLECRGVSRGALYLAAHAVPGAPAHVVRAHAERRYGHQLGDLVRADGRFRGLFIMLPPVAELEEEDGCL
ncbi:MAG TPA: DnaA N-terminal domain-containing protein [Solirubrobacterales bacterium]|nr:DnaA N-terminal domain-containing protein [Solirubrobacterales bacterium]